MAKLGNDLAAGQQTNPTQNLVGGRDAQGRPIMPGFRDQRDQRTGFLGGNLELQDPFGGKNAPRQGWQMLRDEAQRTGPSAWRQAEEGRQTDALARQGSSAMSTNLNRQAMTGGLRGGASERMGQQNLKQQLMGGQDMRSKLGAEDANRQWQAVQALPGAELAESTFQQGTQQYNIDQAMQQEREKRAMEMMKYKEDMRGWASVNTAAATPSSDSGGMCFITTAVCEKLGLADDNKVLNDFRAFRDEHMGGKEAVAEYYEVAPKIVAAIKEADDEKVYYSILSEYLIPALSEIHAGNNEKAEDIYTSMVAALKALYLGEK